MRATTIGTDTTLPVGRFAGPGPDPARDIGLDLPHGSGAVTLPCNIREKDEITVVIAAGAK